MEITTSEEVHLLALFEFLSDLLQFQNVIDQHLFGENDETRFGVQAIVNEQGEVEGLNNQLLIGATDLSIDTLIDNIHQLKGLAIPAHIDRESFSVLSQLGFIDDNSRFDALEISKSDGYRTGTYPIWRSESLSVSHILRCPFHQGYRNIDNKYSYGRTDIR